MTDRVEGAPDPEVRAHDRELAGLIGRSGVCRATGVPRSTYCRHNRVSPAPPRPAPKPQAERVQPRALAPQERARVREVLNS